MVMALHSDAFQNGDRIPPEYTCQGEGLSPPLRWDNVPTETASLALIMDDPDSSGGTMTHWLLYDIPPGAGAVAEGEQGLGTEGRNGFSVTGYRGPCPPEDHGEHRYRFTLHALDVDSLGLPPGATREQLESTMRGHVLEVAELVGTFEKPRGE